MDVLEKLFDSPVRARLLKLFLMNPDVQFSVADASRQLQLRSSQVTAEVRRLGELGLIRSTWARVTVLPIGRAKKRHSRPEARRVKVCFANKEYPFFSELRALCLKSAPHAKGPLAAKIKRVGSIKLAVLAGVFIDSPTSRVDMLLVGDGFRKARLKSLVQWLEAKVGKELNYVAMSYTEFKYRMDMYDRFVRDILEFPHETVINKLGV
jgi:DNA-binding MarR family transcriptional regulator